ncbi:MAG: EamA family transporter [Trichodesmium sp. MAG_R04]|nr:EamA family transporter [Trichodesmium sp. MAG_R04]
MSLTELALLLISTLMSAIGQTFLKFGANKLGQVTAGNSINHILNIIKTPELLFGLFCYGIGAIFYILLLTRVNLSIAGPSASIIYVFSVLVGYFIFKESILPSGLFGLGFIILGVILVVGKH